MNCSLPGSSVHGIFQARVLEWGAIAFSNPINAAAAAKSLQSCPTLCNPIDQAPPSLGFSRQEHWSGLPFPSPMHEREKVKVKSLSHVRLLVTPWTAAHQAPLSMGFSRQEYWSGVPDFTNDQMYSRRRALLQLHGFTEHVPRGFPGGSVVKNPPPSEGDMGSIPDLERSHTPRSNWAWAPQLLSPCSRVWEPQLQKPTHPRAPAP